MTMLAAVILQPGDGPIGGHHYLPSTPDTVRWGWLPNQDDPAVLRMQPGDVVTIDTVSHEGLLEDYGRDPVAWFGQQGVPKDDVLADAVDIAAAVEHDERRAGPHVVTGPIHIDGAEPGDLLAVDVLAMRTRVPYGVISSRHGYGSLPGEFPLTPPPEAHASVGCPDAYHSVMVFTPVEERGGRLVGRLPFGDGRLAVVPLAPFLGVMGVAPATSAAVHSVPPGRHGGNIDVKWLAVGSRLYLPVQVPGAGFHVGDPHFAQGNGEVCLTALEGSLRAELRLSILKGEQARTAAGLIAEPFAETDDHWIPIGLHEDLDEAMRQAVRHAVAFLGARLGMEPHLAYAYLSAAADFEVSQVVDGVKGIHCLIRKRDFTT
jgi:acetamidase/formamidase